DEVGPAQPGYRAADHDIGVPHEVDVDTHCVGGTGVLAYGAGAQSPAREEKDEVGYANQNESEPHNGLVLEELAKVGQVLQKWKRRSQKCEYISYEWDCPGRQGFASGWCVAGEILVVEKAGDAESEYVDHCATDDLVCLEGHGK